MKICVFGDSSPYCLEKHLWVNHYASQSSGFERNEFFQLSARRMKSMYQVPMLHSCHNF